MDNPGNMNNDRDEHTASVLTNGILSVADGNNNLISLENAQFSDT